MTQIRYLSQSDFTAILEIYRPFITDSAVSFEEEVPSFEAFSQRLSGIAEKYPFMVVEDQGKILGYAYASLHRERKAYRWITETTIYMAQEARGQGLGKRLYSTLLDELSRRHFTLAYGIITLPNAASISLHAACGFENMVVHKNAGWKRNAWHDVLWMKKELGPFETPPTEPVFINCLGQPF